MKEILEQITIKKNKINQLHNELWELESTLGDMLIGSEITYRGEKGIIESIDVLEGQVNFEMEDVNGYKWNEWISLYELEELIKGN